MQYTIKQYLVGGLACAAILSTVACTPRRIPQMTVSDLMEDRVTLDGVLMKCNQNPAKARSDMDCLNARIAIERLAKDVDPAEEAKRMEDFERSREQLRIAQERIRKEQEAKTKVDAYSLPVVPVEPQTPPNATGHTLTGQSPASGRPPMTGQTRP